MAKTAAQPPIRLAADIGGTFTDIVLEAHNRRFTTKILTTPRAPEAAVVEGTHRVLADAGLEFSHIDTVIHGTTLATNAIIERKGARTALIATEGFRDVIEIADEGRFDQYDLYIEKPEPLVRRQWRFTVPERMNVHGDMLLPLDEAAVAQTARQMKALAIEAVAVALIHSYANDRHERRIAEIFRQELPSAVVTLSSEVCPEAREYERTSTAIANAYVQPMMSSYLERLRRAFADLGYDKPIHLMTSGGSLATLETAARFPIRLVESGPAGGAILAAEMAEARGHKHVLSFDMGGTTAKICLLDHSRPMMARTFEIDRRSRFRKGSGFPVRIPVIEMVEIGAGGGSLAKVDQLKRIIIGPESAGSEPGPACYGRGGTQPTVTDADMMLGKIDPERFAGGSVILDRAAAHETLRATLARSLATSVEEAANGISEIVDENMASAARVHAIERGADVAGRTMIAFGGAAPLHASRLAEKLGIARIIVPADAGVGSAVGFLSAPAAFELIRSLYVRLDKFEPSPVNDALASMEKTARAYAESAAAGRPVTTQRSAFVRYAGQGHEIEIALPQGLLTQTDTSTLRRRFETEYDRLFARHIPGATIEIMSFVVVATTGRQVVEYMPNTPAAQSPPAPLSIRTVFDTGASRAVDAPVYERSGLPPGTSITGPCLIVEPGTSTYVSPRFCVRVDAGLALVLERNG